MCGIAAALSLDGSRTRQPTWALPHMRHRGPDGVGFAALGAGQPTLEHCRLAIIDPDNSQADQPMSDESGRWTIVYNGELFNYKQLRRELEQRGARFRTDSDTEVVLRALALDGESALSAFRGMFAFVLWDAEEGRLLAARDHVGVKPLYYAVAGGVLRRGERAPHDPGPSRGRRPPRRGERRRIPLVRLRLRLRNAPAGRQQARPRSPPLGTRRVGGGGRVLGRAPPRCSGDPGRSGGRAGRTARLGGRGSAGERRPGEPDAVRRARLVGDRRARSASRVARGAHGVFGLVRAADRRVGRRRAARRPSSASGIERSCSHATRLRTASTNGWRGSTCLPRTRPGSRSPPSRAPCVAKGTRCSSPGTEATRSSAATTAG